MKKLGRPKGAVSKTPSTMDILGAKMFAYIGAGHNQQQTARRFGTTPQYVGQCVKRLQTRLSQFSWGTDGSFSIGG